jgi:hypothetical protein
VPRRAQADALLPVLRPRVPQAADRPALSIG